MLLVAPSKPQEENDELKPKKKSKQLHTVVSEAPQPLEGILESDLIWRRPELRRLS